MLRSMIVLLFAVPAFAAEPPAPVGARIADFEAVDPVAGKPWKLAEETRESKATVLLFLNTSCPVSKAYVPRLLELRKRFGKEGVAFAAVFSQATDTTEDIKKHAKDFAITFPALKDDGAKLAAKLNVDRLPTAFVLDAAKTVRYAGRIDDQFAPGVHRANATTRELADAIDAIVEGREVKVPFVAAAGCALTVEKPVVASKVTFHEHVEKILQTRCQDCHRTGEAGPFSLLTFKDAKGWASMIREVVAGDIMPPWSADAPHGRFSNDRRLSAEEKKTLLDWLDAGCPEGDAAQAPPPRKFVEGWRLGREPDQVLRMSRTISVPASGWLGMGMPYQYIQAGETFKEDKWITAVEVRPEFRPAVHHIIAFIVPPGKTLLDIGGDDFGRNMLGAFVPGDDPIIMPPGFARKVLKGSKIIFELHYTPMGKPGKDCSMAGLCFSSEAPKHEVFGDAIFNARFAIPPGAANHEVKSTKTFKKETVLLALAPHMHVHGKSFRYDLQTPDGKSEMLLNVPKYDFNWQLSYRLATPRTIPAGSKIICTAVFDNSAKNPFNPNPEKRVRWGTQTWEEMMIGFVSFYEK